MLHSDRFDPRLKVIHADMDAFFAAVEVLDDPSLSGKPLVIGHPGPRGVVSTASYEARQFGVHSAMPSTEALRRCPEAIWRSPRGKRYGEVSRIIMEVFREFTPTIEPLSVDEAFLDISGSLKLFHGALAIGEGVRRRVHEATGGLTVSIGIAPNKFLAKLASDLDKPDGMTVVDPDGIQELLDPLPVKKIWGVGPRMTEALHQIGLKTIQDLRKGGVDLLQRRFGENSAHRLWNLAHGRDERGFGDRSPAKSISTENTFSKDISRGPASDRFLRNSAEEIAESLRREGWRTRTLRLKVRISSFETFTRSKTLETPIQDAATLYQIGREMLRDVDLKGEGIRLLGLGAAGLVSADEPVQNSLFSDESVPIRDEKVTRLIDQAMTETGSPLLKRGSVVTPPPETSRGGRRAATADGEEELRRSTSSEDSQRKDRKP